MTQPVPVTLTMSVVQEKPWIIAYKDFMSKAECEQMIAQAEPFLHRSATFSGGADNRRTSYSAFASNFPNDPVLIAVTARAAALVNYPMENVEPPQVVRYLDGEFFLAHNDNYTHDNPSYIKSGQRDVTFFVYLNEPSGKDQTGGETHFINFGGLKSAPERGTAIVWRNADIDTLADLPQFLHEGLPPQGWTKWGMNIWVRHKKFEFL